MNRVNVQPDHATVKVPFGENDIDLVVQLAPLIPLLWELDIETFQCRQEARPGHACIEFAGSSDVEAFLNVAQRDYKVEIETWDQGEDGLRDIRVRLLVLFPKKDIPRLVKQFQRAAEGAERLGCCKESTCFPCSYPYNEQ